MTASKQQPLCDKPGRAHVRPWSARGMGSLRSAAMSSPADVVAPIDPFRRVRLAYLVGTCIYNFGFGLFSLASFLIVYDTTRSVTATGLIMVCLSLPQVLLPGVATRLSQSWGGPKLYVVGSTLGGILTLVPAGLSMAGVLNVPTLLAFYVGLGLIYGAMKPSGSMIRMRMAAPGRLAELNGNVTVAWALATAAGYLLGSSAYTYLGTTWVFFIGALACLPISLSIVPMMRNHARRAPEALRASTAGEFRVDADTPAATDATATDATDAEDTATEDAERFRDVFGVWRANGGIRAIMLVNVLICAVGGFTVVLPALARTLGSDAFILSLLEASSVLGGLFVTVIIKGIKGRLGWFIAIRLHNMLMAACFVALVVVVVLDGSAHPTGFRWVSLLVAIGAVLGIGLGLNFDSSVLSAMIQHAAPHTELAAVLEGYALIALVVVPLGQEVIGAVADSVSLAAGVAMPLVMMVCFLVFYPRSNLRREFNNLDGAAVENPSHMLRVLGAHERDG